MLNFYLVFYVALAKGLKIPSRLKKVIFLIKINININDIFIHNQISNIFILNKKIYHVQFLIFKYKNIML